ncbi:ribosomal oxygenase 1 [Cylas formicarius]|uniref:ribosomal oxygenase 1 n=1 Tax=Cylas formicarius TaxID=197179 RepID=UPI0029585C47|nr:ribosomal oxygenase 1 [Cylas formicarius]
MEEVSAFEIYRSQHKTSTIKKRKRELLKKHVSSKKLKSINVSDDDHKENKLKPKINRPSVSKIKKDSKDSEDNPFIKQKKLATKKANKLKPKLNGISPGKIKTECKNNREDGPLIEQKELGNKKANKLKSKLNGISPGKIKQKIKDSRKDSLPVEPKNLSNKKTNKSKPNIDGISISKIKKKLKATRLKNPECSPPLLMETSLPVLNFEKVNNMVNSASDGNAKNNRVIVIDSVKIPSVNTAKNVSELADGSPPLLVPIKKVKQINYDKNSGSPLNNPIATSLAVFKWLLYPVKPRDFFEKVWEKEILHIERSNKDYYKDILTTDGLDRILRDFPLYYTRNVDVVNYENGVKEVLNQEGRAVPSALWDFYLNGCSIRVLNPQTYDHKVHFLISALQEYFGTMVGTNVYLTPPRSQGFAPHFDDIEAFIVQLEGRKHWKLYKPHDQDVLTRDSSPNFRAEDLGRPFMEVTLDAGDMLYFPRGTIHEGRTDEEHSLHITVSVYQHTAYADLLEHIVPAALKKAAMENVEFRRGLPLNFLKHVGHVNKNSLSKKRTHILAKVRDLMSTLIDYVDVDLAADQIGRKFMHDAMPPLCSQQEAANTSRYDGDYMRNGRVFNRVEIGLETRVRLLRYHSVRLVVESDTASKLFYCTENSKTYHGEEEQWLEMEDSFCSVVEALQKVYPAFVEVEQLPMEDAVTKIQLVSDLWERGILVTDRPLMSVSSDVDGEASSKEDVSDGDS